MEECQAKMEKLDELAERERTRISESMKTANQAILCDTLHSELQRLRDTKGIDDYMGKEL